MTDQPTPEDAHPPEPGPSKGRGIGLGVAATLGAVIVAVVIAGLLGAFTNFEGGVAIAYSPLLVIALLVAAGIYWRKTPGFLLGMAITIGVGFVLGTACTAALVSSGTIG